jgi:hypothetical protein
MRLSRGRHLVWVCSTPGRHFAIVRTTNQLFRRAALSLSVVTLLLGARASSVAAQDKEPCPFTNDGVVSQALGGPVQGYADPSLQVGFETCEFGDITLYRQSGAFAAGQVGVAGLAQNVVLGLPDAVSAQIAGLGAGQTLEVPGYQIASIGGLGDAALWVKNSSFGVDALVVQRGAEVFSFQVLDTPDARAKLTALAPAVLANAPAAASVVVPSGDRPAVIADCGLDAANAVADRLPRSDVTNINVIGGCHYVAIATSLSGGGFENASAASAICDQATEVAYSGGILGITVTDRDGHERASGANGEPCSGFP